MCVTKEGRDMIFDQTKHYEKTTVKLVFLFHVTTRKMDVGILAYMSHAFLVCMSYYCTKHTSIMLTRMTTHTKNGIGTTGWLHLWGMVTSIKLVWGTTY